MIEPNNDPNTVSCSSSVLPVLGSDFQVQYGEASWTPRPSLSHSHSLPSKNPHAERHEARPALPFWPVESHRGVLLIQPQSFHPCMSEARSPSLSASLMSQELACPSPS